MKEITITSIILIVNLAVATVIAFKGDWRQFFAVVTLITIQLAVLYEFSKGEE